MPRLMLMMTLLLTAMLPTVATAQAPGTIRPDAEATHQVRQSAASGSFSSADRNLIRAWLQEAERRPTAELPPGLQKKVARGKPLPPGWQKKLARGARLDHDYYRNGVALPDDLLRRLSPPPPGTEILQIEDRILRLDAATRTILDVFGLSGR